jgi:polysaccharide biosynthesis protein VpsQ
MTKWAILCVAAIVLIVVLADTQHLGFLHAVYDIPYGDKVGHFALYGLLSLLANLAAFERRPNTNPRTVALVVSPVLAVLIGLEELSQRWIPSRTYSLLDLAASYLGVAVFAWIAVEVAKRGRKG